MKRLGPALEGAKERPTAWRLKAPNLGEACGSYSISSMHHLLQQECGFFMIGIVQFKSGRLGYRLDHRDAPRVQVRIEGSHILPQALEAFFFSDARDAAAKTGAALQESDIIDAAFRSRANRQIRREHFDGWLTFQLPAYDSATQFRKQLGHLRAKAKAMRLADHGAPAVPNDAAGIVGDEGPTATGAGVGEGTLAYARIAVQQYAGSLPSDASGVQGGDIVQFQQYANQRIQKMPAKEHAVGQGRAGHTRIPETPVPVDHGEILLVRYPHGQVPLSSQDRRGRQPAAAFAHHHVHLDRRPVEPGCISAEALMRGIQHFAHIARYLHRKSIGVKPGRIRKRRPVLQRVVDSNLDSVGSRHLYE